VPLELKATINLPRTAFPMKANLPQNEPKRLAQWEQMRIYDRVRAARRGAPRYVLHDGPPYANGPIHLGTAFNKCLKDFVVKSKTMAGFDSPYVPGWDCHGLPIEIRVDESLGRKKLQMQPIEVRRACRQYAEKYLDLQRAQFQRIGIFGRWEQPYSTMSPQYEAVVIAALYSFFDKGAVYRGLRPVYWCIHCMTALAEAEVEYENHTSPSISVRYRLTSEPAKIDPALAGKRVSTIIWTTTPWTLPASMAVAFHPEEEYVALELEGEEYVLLEFEEECVALDLEGEVFIVADKLAAVTAQSTFLAGAREIARFPGSRLEYATFAHPFLDRQILGVLANYVTMDQGTGAVHTAPSHGADDFYTGVKYNLDQTCNVDAAGVMHNGLPEYEGKTVFEANAPIVELLRARGVLMHAEKIEHSYPHCWRCHNPVIFRATEQWFISMEAEIGGGRLRQRALEEITKVKWDPAWGEERIANMLSTRPDWCISRQRMWGVPIAVFYCEGCNEILRSPAAREAVVELFAREGADAWFVRDAASILPAGTKCACGSTKFRKEMDIVDVWFESGCSQDAVLGRESGLPWPADLYLEGGDQYRGWFHSSLLCALGTHGSAPYHAVATPGWTLDAQGRPMSKSLGNTVDPVDVAERLGGEIVRLWVASVDFREDVRASEELMQRVAEQYRKIRNTFRYILGNLDKFDPQQHAVAFSEMEGLDRYMLLRTAAMAQEVLRWYGEFEFHRIYHRIHDFCVVDLSNTYFDILKDRLYTFAPESRARRSAQTAIWRIGEALVRLLAPVMSFTADEIWSFLPAVAGRPESVHLAQFPAPADITGDTAAASGLEELKSDWETLLGVRDEVLKALEEARNRKLIGGSLEAQVRVSAPEPVYSLLERYRAQLRYVFIVSQVTLAPAPSGDGASGIQVEVGKAAGQKCERCWNYSVHVGEDRDYPMVCERCSAALDEIEAAAAR
jgi:isoleucyl-tRNA synthetase